MQPLMIVLGRLAVGEGVRALFVPAAAAGVQYHMDSRRDQMTTVSTLEARDITIEEIPPAVFDVPLR